MFVSHLTNPFKKFGYSFQKINKWAVKTIFGFGKGPLKSVYSDRLFNVT